MFSDSRGNLPSQMLRKLELLQSKWLTLSLITRYRRVVELALWLTGQVRRSVRDGAPGGTYSLLPVLVTILTAPKPYSVTFYKA